MGLAEDQTKRRVSETESALRTVEADLTQNPDDRIIGRTRLALNAVISSGVLDLALAHEFLARGISDRKTLGSALQKFRVMNPAILEEFLQTIVERIAAIMPENISASNVLEIDAFIGASGMSLDDYNIFLEYWNQTKQSTPPFARLKLLIFDDLMQASDTLAERVWKRFPKPKWYQRLRRTNPPPTAPQLDERPADDIFFARSEVYPIFRRVSYSIRRRAARSITSAGRTRNELFACELRRDECRRRED